MDTNEIKKLVAKHFDYSTPNGGNQYLHGDWFTPKHKDALSDLLEEIGEGVNKDTEEEIEDLEAEIEALKSKIESKDARIEELEKELKESRS